MLLDKENHYSSIIGDEKQQKEKLEKERKQLELENINL